MRTTLVKDLPDFPISDPRQLEAFEQWLCSGLSWEDALKASEWGAGRIRPISGGAIAVDAPMIQNTPAQQPVVHDTELFMLGTERTEHRVAQVAYAAGATWNPVEIPTVGVVGKIVIQFDGTVTQTTAAGTTTPLWPYGLLDHVEFTGNASDALFSCGGVFLKMLEAVRYPYLNNSGDDLLGPGQGGGLTLNTGATSLRLTFEMPFSMDEASLIGALFAQSTQLQLHLTCKDAAVAKLVTNTTGSTAIAGTWHISTEMYRIPSKDGAWVLPDLRFLHGFHQGLKPHANSGEVEQKLTRTHGALQRLFVQNIKDTANPVVFFNPTSKTDVLRYELKIHNSKKPRIYTPAQGLVSRNVRDYGRVLPYSGVVLDLARWNTTRDVIQLNGLTELAWISEVAAPTNGQQVIVQETLFV